MQAREYTKAIKAYCDKRLGLKRQSRYSKKIFEYHITHSEKTFKRKKETGIEEVRGEVDDNELSDIEAIDDSERKPESDDGIKAAILDSNADLQDACLDDSYCIVI